MKIHRSYMLFAYTSLFVMGISDNIRGPIFSDMIKQFGLDQNTASLFFSVSSAMNIVGGYSCSLLLKHLGRMQTLRLAHLLLSLSFLGVWAAPSFLTILLCMFFYGISIGVMGVVENVMVVEASLKKDHQKWLSGFQSMYGLASLASPLLVTSVRQFSPAWQTAFFINAIFGFILVFFSLFGSEKETPYHEEDTYEGAKPGNVEFYYYAAIFALYVAAEIMVSSRLAQFARDSAGWSLDSASILNSLFFVGIFFGRAIFVIWTPQISLKFQMLLSVGVGSLACLVGTFINPYAFVITGLSFAPFYPLGITVAAKLFKSELSRVTGYAMGLTGVAVVTMQTAVGSLSQGFGLKIGLLVGPLFGVIAMAMILSYSYFFKKELP